MSSIEIKSLEYEFLDDCKCGPEEFFVLVSSIDWEQPEELEAFIGTLADLVNRGLLQVRRGKEAEEEFSVNRLRDYVDQRQASGEPLDTYPESVKEYTFETTEAGISSLREEDRPIRWETIEDRLTKKMPGRVDPGSKNKKRD